MSTCVLPRLQHGDPFVASFVNKILQAVCVPLFHMIRRYGTHTYTHTRARARACAHVRTDRTSQQHPGVRIKQAHSMSVRCVHVRCVHVCCVSCVHVLRWVFEGVLEDPHQEFFVRAAPWAASVTDKNPSE